VQAEATVEEEHRAREQAVVDNAGLQMRLKQVEEKASVDTMLLQVSASCRGSLAWPTTLLRFLRTVPLLFLV
jgi:hypothetical protein